jgi:hypothetical protein
MATAPGSPPRDPDLIVPNDASSLSFVQGLIDRGEAGIPNSDGSLPPRMTHVIVGKTDAGHPILRRVRFGGI